MQYVFHEVMGIGVGAPVNMQSSHSGHKTRGAALIVAIGILAVLLVISVTFFKMSLQESNTAKNNAVSIQADLLADGAIAMAMDTLQQDQAMNPGVTHSDQAWRAKYNGTGYIKDWFSSTGVRVVDGGIPLIDPAFINVQLKTDMGIPLTDPDVLLPEDLDGRIYIPRIESVTGAGYNSEIPGYIDPLSGNEDMNRYLDADAKGSVFPFAVTTEFGLSMLTAPLISTNGLEITRTLRNPFDEDVVTPDIVFENGDLVFGGWLPEEQIHFIADVDVDGDQLNDAIWIPMAGDRLYPNDGLDNDLDGFIDEYDLDGEPGLFMYADNYIHGVDDIATREIIFTLPLSRMFMWRVRTEGNVNAWNDLLVVPADLNFDSFSYGNFTTTAINDFDYVVPVATVVDGTDNDYNGIINDGTNANHYFLNQDFRSTRPLAVLVNDRFHYPGIEGKMADAEAANPGLFIEYRILGEVTSDIIGRAGIYITDESSKVNINEAGGLTYIAGKAVNLGDLVTPDIRDHQATPLTPSTGTGQDAHQYDLRALDQIGPSRADRLWVAQMGSNFGDGFSGEGLTSVYNDALPLEGYDDNNGLTTAYYPVDDSIYTQTANFANMGNLVYDISFPGYGFMDDNGSALWMAINGIDDDGDAYWYQNDGIDNDGNDLIDDPGEGLRVGVDEGLVPYNYDGVDNFPADGEMLDDYATLEGIDEPSEFQRYRPYRNIAAELDLDSGNPLLDGDLVGGADVLPIDNDRDGNPNEIGEFGDNSYRTAEQIKGLVDIVGTRPVGVFTEQEFSVFEPFITIHSGNDNLSHDYTTNVLGDHTATGIKLDYNFASPKEIVTALLRNFEYRTENPASVTNEWDWKFPKVVLADTPLAVPVDIVEGFAAGLRQEDTTVDSATSILGVAVNTGDDEHVRFESDAELRAHQLAVSAKDFSDADSSRSSLTLTLNDPWLADETLTYTQAGVEAIRINEIMVRAVRRVEAEATSGLGGLYNPNMFGANDFNVSVVTMAEHIESLLLPNIEALYRAPLAVNDVVLNGDSLWGIANVFSETTNIFSTLGRVNYDGGAGFNATTTSQPLMGIRSAYGTDQHTVGYSYDDGNDLITGDLPNLIQFSFAASDQLPAGRYYLTINTQFVAEADDAPNSILAGDILNSVGTTADFKYFMSNSDGTPAEDILTQITENIIDGIDTNFIVNNAVTPVVLGEDGLGDLTGMAFMQGNRINNDVTDQFQNSTVGYVVEVPATGVLNVAIMSNLPQGVSFAVNYFDFSQEPDHEYVELVNTSDDEVDLSGWKLVVEGDNGIEMTVPDNTVISPKGYLLLGTNKYDYVQAIAGVLAQLDPDPGNITPVEIEALLELQRVFDSYDSDSSGGLDILELQVWQNTFTPSLSFNSQITDSINAIEGLPINSPLSKTALTMFLEIYTRYYGTTYANGIGLARDLAGGTYGDITVPFQLTRLNNLLPQTFDDPNSVFARNSGTLLADFIDNDGNGYDDSLQVDRIGGAAVALPAPLTYTGTKSVDNTIQNTGVQSPYAPAGLSTNRAAAWDRIVELEIPALESLNTIGQVAKFVLDGGIFPNYPEMDGYDNDSDNLTLESDIYDNNGDGISAIEDDEGIDEGFDRLHPGTIAGSLLVPGGYQQGVIALNLIDPITSVFGPVAYPVAPTDPVEWKAFVEKRLFPGDNVIVTLYEGRPSAISAGLDITKEANIADQITYTEMDVIDRAKDDVVTYTAGALATDAQAYINPSLTSMWPPNTMGIDFYKSLERKHPLYNGDKHGTTNRSEPTDGAYDDWADSSHYHVREVVFQAADGFNYDLSSNGAVDLFGAASGTEPEYRQHALFDHAIFGSPLRMNLAQRKMENASVPAADGSQTTFVLEGQFDLALDNDGVGGSQAQLGIERGVSTDRQTMFPLASVRNKAIVSPGDLMNMPHFDRIQRMRAPVAGGFTVDFSAVNQRIVFDDGTPDEARYADNSVRQIMLGQTFGDENWDTLAGLADFYAVDYRVRDDNIDIQNNLSNDLAQLIANTAANDALSLSVATAEVVPFDKSVAGDGTGLETHLATAGVWDPSASGVAQDWVPVLLHPLLLPQVPPLPAAGVRPLEVATTFNNPGYSGIADIYEENYLLDATIFGNLIPDTLDRNRLPNERRAVSYAARNDGAFNPDRTIVPDDGKEVMFIWDGDAGIENGEYDVYIEVNTDFRQLFETHNGTVNPSPILDTNFGERFVTESLSTDFENMLMDVEVFTDRDGNGRVWALPNALPLGYAELNSFATTTTINESFEQLLNAAPDRNGYINYGSVLIENNYLALFIRNRADSSVLNRISRVVLAPRAKTPGRLNINTVETQLTADQTRFFNPLVGIPAIQYGYNEFQGIFGQAVINDAVVTTDPNYDASVYVFFDTAIDRPSLGEENDPEVIHHRAQKITRLRPEHPDGRYYEFVTDLVAQQQNSRMVYPSILSELGDDSDHDGGGAVGNEESPRFQESQERFRRMVNMVSTRSDVFKIQVLVQTGHVTDGDDLDTIANYRDDSEFTITSEARASVIYER